MQLFGVVSSCFEKFSYNFQGYRIGFIFKQYESVGEPTLLKFTVNFRLKSTYHLSFGYLSKGKKCGPVKVSKHYLVKS